MFPGYLDSRDSHPERSKLIVRPAGQHQNTVSVRPHWLSMRMRASSTMVDHVFVLTSAVVDHVICASPHHGVFVIRTLAL